MSKQQFAAIKTKEKGLMKADISCLRNQWFQKYKNQLKEMVERLPPLREVNHKIPLIDDSKCYAYHLPHTDALKQQLSDKIQQYTDANWWVMTSVPKLPQCFASKRSQESYRQLLTATKGTITWSRT